MAKILQMTFLMHFNVNIRISITISLKFVPKRSIDNIPALVQIMPWRRSEDKPLYQPMTASLLTHIYVTPLNEHTWDLNL